MAGKFYLGKRLSYDKNLCTVRYLGEVQGTKGTWLGVEWDDPTRGKHFGEYGGVKYYECVRKHPTAGSFIRPTRPSDPRLTFIEALHKKYASEQGTGHDDQYNSINGTRNTPITISGKEVEEVGFDKIRRQLADLQELRIVLLDGHCIGQQESPSPEQPLADDPSIGPSFIEDSRHIKEVCPKVTELDLSRNLLETWSEVAHICHQLTKLKILRVGGNRFRLLQLEQRSLASSSFPPIMDLNLDDTLLGWSEITDLTETWFGSLVTFSASNNDFGSLSTVCDSVETLPLTVRSLSLDGNGFTSLDDVAVLANLPHLQTLSLKNNSIRTVGPQSNEQSFPVFAQSLFDVDLSFNAIDSWAVIDRLQDAFPGLTALRVSHNPLYQDLRSGDGRPLNYDNGYTLTVARIGRLKTLNFSRITPKERLDAEAYYLSQIAAELSRHPLSLASEIIARHRRYAELCQEYGEPIIRHDEDSTVNPNSLAARLITCNFRLAESAQKPPAEHRLGYVTKELPRSFNMYSVLGVAGKAFGLPPMKLKLIWETGEWDPAPRDASEELLWADSESDDSNSDVEEAKSGHRSLKTDDNVLREVELVAGLRPLGTWIEGSVANVRVEMR